MAKNPSLDSVDGRHQVIYGAVHSVQVAYYDLALYTSSNRVPSIHFFQTKTLHLPSVIIDLIGHKKSRKTLLRDAYENKKKNNKNKAKKTQSEWRKKYHEGHNMDFDVFYGTNDA